MYDTQSISGCGIPVDNSGSALGQGGYGPTPQGTSQTLPVNGYHDEGVGVCTPAPTVKVGVGLPDSSPLDKPTNPSVILNDTANLDEFFTIPLYPPSHCSPKYMVLECNCGRRIVPSTCMALDCENCKEFVGRRRSDSILRRLLQGTLYQRRRWWKTAVIYTVFTVPESHRERMCDRHEWQRTRKKAWNILKKNFGAKYGVEITHPVGDKDKSRFHPHLNFLWIQHAGYRPFLDQAVLYQQWKNVLKADSVNVYSQYSHSIPKIIHWCKYVSRTFPGTHKWSGPMRWYGKYPKDVKPERCTCLDCGCHFRVIGYIEAEEVDRYHETGYFMGLDPPWYDDSKILHVRRPLLSNAVPTQSKGRQNG